MLILLIVIAAGFLLGKLVRVQWHAIVLSVPLGVATHVALLVLTPWVATAASPGFEPAFAFAGGLLCIPFAAMGVVLAHGNRRRETA